MSKYPANTSHSNCRDLHPIDLSTVREISKLIVERFDPVRIVLFGSLSRGVANHDSDVDLLVELPLGRLIAKRGNPIRRAVAEQFILPIDIIVRTSDDIDRHRSDVYSVIHHALNEGLVLYDKQAA